MSEEYIQGYKAAERRILVSGFPLAKLLADAYPDDLSDYAVGYRTAVGVAEERRAR